MTIIKIFNIAIFFLATIIDFMVLIGTFIYSNISIISFIMIHSILIGVIYVYIRLINKENDRIPFYLAFFIPGFGITLILIQYSLLVMIKSNSSLIEDYDKYIKYINRLIIRNNTNYYKEINTISALDALNISDNERKKDVIIDLMSHDIGVKVGVLKKALRDEDSEVVHYASSTLNLIEEEYEKQINMLRKEYIKNNSPQEIRELIKIYSNYLESGLITHELLEFEINEYMGIIDEYIQRYGGEYEILLKKVDAYIKLDKNREAFKILNRIFKEFNKGYEHYFYTLKVLYNMGKYNEVRNVVKKIKQLNIEIPNEYKEIIEFWT